MNYYAVIAQLARVYNYMGEYEKKPLIVHKKYWMPMQKNMLQFVSSCQRRRRYRTMIGNGIKK